MAAPVLVPSATLRVGASHFPDFSAVRKSQCRTCQHGWRGRNSFFQRDVASQLIGRQGKYTQWSRNSEVSKRLAPISKIATQQSSSCEVFEGLDGSGTPVGVCETRSLSPALSVEEAMITLHSAIRKLEVDPPSAESGTLRFQVPLPPGLKALQWLQSQPENPVLLPRSYFSPRQARENGTGDMTNGSAKQFFKLDVSGVGGVAGVGAAVLFSGSESFSLEYWKAIKRFLSKRYPIIRAYGAMRFDPKLKPSKEWRPFGSFYFFIPQIEFCECEGCSLLAVTLAWDEAMRWPLVKALEKARRVMQMVSTRICPDNERPLAQVLGREHIPNEQAWHDAVNKTLDSLSNQGVEYSDSVQPGVNNRSVLDPPALFKVVMARRTKLEMNGQLDPISLLACLQDKDRSAYQFAIQVPDGSAFIGCSPERLFARDGLLVASEAVAGTRARGSTAVKDLLLGIELMESTKDHFEFEIVRESVKRNMEAVCKNVSAESSKSLLKQARVQHLYARFNGELHDDVGEFDLLSALHPTPAVCGHPQAIAREAISRSEEFDRGLYAGPVGWFGGDGAEFAVGIRSSLIQPWTSNRLQNGAVRSNDCDLEETFSPTEAPKSSDQSKPLSNGGHEASKGTCISLYSGVGVVKDSFPSSEWRELELKTSLFEALLEQRQPLETTVNINALWAKLIVEELCRLGITYFCIAPGSRSSPLVAAAAANPRITCVSCIDERSMAFLAVGYGRGANKPAVVVTSSGTAVSNLLPAVVEASQDFVPLVVLTADRPAELYDAGANQTIDQDKHFGGFVRYHANLPAADDRLPAKMVLTTVDAAVNRAMIAPSGPVHINCAFREPLAGNPAPWSTTCLKGLKRWSTTSTPYTQYIDSKPRLLGGVHPTFVVDLEAVAKLIGGAKEGLLVVGGLSAAEETWAVALLAQHLGWPVVPDVISGLRIGEALCTEGAGERKVNVIHNFDQILLSKDVARSSKPDVVLQIGGRLTSKRLSSFLEAANLQAYILVEEHSSRQDPAHIVTHRIQSCTADFSSTIMKFTESKPPTAFCGQLRLLSEVVEREIHLKLQAESSLTEPYVAHYVVSCLPSGSALFLGNSMPIRDVDMYAHGAIKVLGSCKYEEDNWDQALPHIGTRVGANRGASGIDGVVSTAIGFAAGSRQRVTLLLGDVSFLHDTNGLGLLSERTGQPPVTVVVVNNSGGGIFSLLPVAKTMPEDSFTTFISTPHSVDLKKLCQAHRVDHWLVRTKDELKHALHSIQGSPLHWVIEVVSRIEDNADYHRFLNQSIGEAVTRAFHVLSKFPAEVGYGTDHGLKILEANYTDHSFPLAAPPTTLGRSSSKETMRRGFLLKVTLFNGTSGIGEIAPLVGLHKETLLDVEEQLRVIVEKLKGLVLVRTIPLLDGSFSYWLSKVVGIQESTLFPSVRTGIEMAVLGALAASQGCSLSELLSGITKSSYPGESLVESLSSNAHGSVRVCGLLDSDGSPEDTADAAVELVNEGFCTLKLKACRRQSSLEDAAMVKLVRERVGPSIHLRADANRRWSYEEAVDFANSIQSCGLQYLEEPTNNPLDIPRFCHETGLAVALDESLDEDTVDIEKKLQMYACQGVVAVVIKPGRVGGFEKSWQIAQWAQMQGMAVVMSSAFESSISLAAFSQFAAHVDQYSKVANSALNHNEEGKLNVARLNVVAHGLGTYKWLNDNPVLRVRPTGRAMEFSVQESSAYLQNVCLNTATVWSNHRRNQISMYDISVNCQHGAFSFHVTESAPVPSREDSKTPTLVFLHGFMGTGADWLPLMDSLSITFRCISVDLPGHGQTTVQEAEGRKPSFSELGEGQTSTSNGDTQGAWSMEGLGAALKQLLRKLERGKVTLVGYSMGARIALYMALRHSEQISAAIIVSGSPGLQNPLAQKVRAAQDDALAVLLRDNELQSFVDSWYRQPLWRSLQTHPDFEVLKRARSENQSSNLLGKALTSFSTGQQPSLWEDLGHCQVPLLMVVGELDKKFVGIAHQMLRASRERGTQLENLQDPFAVSSKQGEVHRNYENVESIDMQTRVMEEKSSSPVSVRTAAGKGAGPLLQLLEVEDAGHAVQIESPLKLVKAIREFALSSTVWPVNR
ncbi:unnamed protein product [Calypogeia fissa]